MKKFRIGIIGSGIQGVCTALFLQKKGYEVTLFDREDPGGAAASYGNAGHFSPYASIPLNRPDIFPLKDIGLLRAISKNYKQNYPPSDQFLKKISKLHAGYRSVFTWYMWRSIDPVDVEY